MVRSRIAALLVLLGVAMPAAADDELLPGATLALRQGKTAARLVIVARASLPAPLPGGTDDPRITGARVDIGNPVTQEWARLNAPSAGWSVNPLGTVFRFRNAAPKERRDQPLEMVIRHGRRLKIVGEALGMTLDEPLQQSLAVVVTTGSRRYCLAFGGKVKRDEPGHFIAHSSPPPAGCFTSDVPAGTTTTTRQPSGTTTSTTRKSLPSTSTTRPSDDDDDDDDDDEDEKPEKPEKPKKPGKDCDEGDADSDSQPTRRGCSS